MIRGTGTRIVHQYARVDYKAVYPGVDLTFDGEQRQLKFNFVVAAGADPALMDLSFSGAKGVATNASGDLILSSSAGDLFLRHPIAYQEENGTRHSVEARFVMKDDKQVGFALGDYDRSRELVIVPSLSRSVTPDLAISSSATALRSNSGTRAFYLLCLPVVGLMLAGVGIAPRRLKWLGLLMACLRVLWPCLPRGLRQQQQGWRRRWRRRWWRRWRRRRH